MTKKLKILGPYTPEHEGPFCTREGQSEPLPTIGYISHIVAEAMRDPTSGINTTQLRAEPNGCVSEPLVFRSDALAKLAEKDAKIARLRQALDEIEMGIDALPDDNEDYSKMSAREMQRQALIIVKTEVKALKGPEA
ncbi:hypothetical protein [Acetobacter pasteurianus]|uniref:hypothetical protein n=1 Tax=Acetobacter pasteurianus TaxID=438 RepID=UPI0003843C92|nr:hypothetical protein [Acetobacter pasteurianus]CCT58541.1 hypothetical protein APA386B_425 [Acetobacter pasteurianus 386B]